jgi:hypothetical protein
MVRMHTTTTMDENEDSIKSEWNRNTVDFIPQAVLPVEGSQFLPQLLPGCITLYRSR